MTAEALPIKPPPPDPPGGSSDVGDVSWVAPTRHFHRHRAEGRAVARLGSVSAVRPPREIRLLVRFQF